MRRLAWILAAVFALGALALALILWRVDTEALRTRLTDTVSESLGQPVTIESLTLAFFPPALRLRGTRVGDPGGGARALARVPEVRLELRLLPLLGGRVVLGTIVLEGAQLRVPDAEGFVDFTAPGPSSASTGISEAALGFAVVADRILVRDATLEFGSVRLEQVRAEGSLALDGSGGLERAGLVLDGTLGGERDGLRLDGPLRFELRIPGRFELDLSGSVLATATGAGKPAGTALRVSGKLDAALPVEQISAGKIVFGEARIPFTAKFDERSFALRVPSGSLDLASLGPLWSDGRAGLRGRVLYGALEAARFRDAGWDLRGEGRFDGVELPLAAGPARVRGRFDLAKQQLRIGPVEIDFGGATVGARGLYALDSGSFEIESVAENAEVAPLVAAFSKRLRVDGRLFGKLSLAGRTGGAGPFQSLSGRGRVQIDDGRIHGLSLLSSIEGSLASVPVLLARLGGRNFSRYEREEFRQLSADFILEGGRAWTNNLVLDYRGARAELRGSIGLEDAGLDLAGRVTLDFEAGPGQLGGGSERRRVIPIAGVTGTLYRPRVRIEASTLLSLASEYAAASPLLERIEERIGSENVEAAKQLLDRILSGGRDRR